MPLRKKCPRGTKRNPKTGRCKTILPRTKRRAKRVKDFEDFEDFEDFADVNTSGSTPVNPNPVPVNAPVNPVNPTANPLREEFIRSQFITRLNDVSILGAIPILAAPPPNNPNQWASPDPFGPRDIEILKMIVDTSQSLGIPLQGVFRPAGRRDRTPYARCRGFTFAGEGSSLSECGVFDVTSGDQIVGIFEDTAKYENAIRTNGILWNTSSEALLSPIDFYESASMGVHGVNVDRCVLTPSGVWRLFTFGYDLRTLPEERVHEIIGGYSHHKQEVIAEGNNEVGDDGIGNFTRELHEYMRLNMEDLLHVEYYDFSGGTVPAGL